MKPKKPIVRTSISGVLIALTLAALIVANIMIPGNLNIINAYLGDQTKSEVKYPDGYSESLDLQYNKADYPDNQAIWDAEQVLNEKIVGEGVTLLKNDDNAMPFAPGTTFSFFGSMSAKLYGNWNKLWDPSVNEYTTLKSSFSDRGFGVNETLWEFYESGIGKNYVHGEGSVNFGDAEDFTINECPLVVMQAKYGLLESAKDTVPIFYFERYAKEGRDMARSMYNHADNSEDQVKNYMEPDSTELEILQYLNDNFDTVVLLINSGGALELGWVDQFPNIKAIVYCTQFGYFGLNALADVFAGTINPSGKTVDTFAYSGFSAPAATNYGDFQYSLANGEMTKYNYVTYKEGIYIGYKYYETRYEDAVMGTGNAGDYDYAATVRYPFGYGLSYTTFSWSNFKADWNGSTCTVTVDVRNTGKVSGKDVVEVYAQTPYTDYDRQNLVEKAAVQLVGYAKTSELAPGASETVTVTFDREQLKAYDYTNAKTYILDAGDYYITAAHDAHDAVNNVLAAKGYTTADGMTADGDTAMVSRYVVDTMDTSTYSVSAAGAQITNQFDFANGGHKYLSRQDWVGTWPTTDGVVSSQLSTWGNEINGADGKPYTYTKTISEEDLAKLDSFDSLSPVDPATIKAEMVYGADNGVQLIELRGKEYDDPLWDTLLDELTVPDYELLLASSHGSSNIDRIGYPLNYNQDGPDGLLWQGTGFRWNGVMVLASTWNLDLSYEFGVLIGNEGLLNNCQGWYAPAMNIHRLPFSGRNKEYYSEDAYLSGACAAVTCRGAASKGMYTFLKHFALNDQENHRGDHGDFSIATWSNEQAIREIYLLPFQMCVESDPITLNYVEKGADGNYKNVSREFPACNGMMTAFNRIGYTWTGACYPLLTSVLREEWGFDGFIITDSAKYACYSYMDCYQMLEAGGDSVLNSQADVQWHMDENNPAHYTYVRNAIHHAMYTVVNSSAVNGVMPGTSIVTPKTLAENILIAINVVGVVLIAALGCVIWFGFRKYLKVKKQQK